MTEAASADTRARIVALARTWLGTPYHHQASVRGAGCDCLGLLRGVYAALYGAEPEVPPPYSPSWAEDRGRETLREAAARHLVALAPDAAEPGDVLLFRWRDGLPAKHCAIVTGPAHMIHAYDGHAVLETWIPPAWSRRIAYAFRFPAIRPDPAPASSPTPSPEPPS
ncbi:NlpC/P60 family protein [Methylobacterium ajmalii]|jgi:NlpC/P60 family putative phage cell wall peptidase|uniref:NlpC/P60 family protein n=1 Tax=Methylobacterium ajmalii TaxID=2738439 RepID=UPI00190AA5FA|nr:NlpC/P60 family protein [Methylobacterium ajmalii]MBK3396624.1 C40 family peptidase [Methylobacterium ajmalii]